MKKLDLTTNSEIVGGRWESRYFKQWYKCLRQNERACRRAARILARHQYQ